MLSVVELAYHPHPAADRLLGCRALAIYRHLTGIINDVLAPGYFSSLESGFGQFVFNIVDRRDRNVPEIHAKYPVFGGIPEGSSL